MYNVKVSEYLESTEVVLYSTPIFGHEKERDGIIIERDNESMEIYSFIAFPTKNKLDDSEKESNKLHSFFVSFNRTKNKIYNYARANKWEWFLTFTFNPAYINSYNYDEIVEAMHVFLRHMGDVSTNRAKYLIVPEKHKSGRYHLHGVFSNLDMSVWRFQYSGHNTKGGIPIYNIGCFPFGFTTATQVQSSTRVSHYIAKYITKDMFDSIKSKKRYWVSRNVSDGIHNNYYMSKQEIEILLNSFGECENVKSVETPYNNIRYYQF